MGWTVELVPCKVGFANGCAGNIRRVVSRRQHGHIYHRAVAKRPSIKDVAAAAGVSPTTVSDALSGKGRLPDSTREAVRREANRLGYRPSRAARSLASGRTGLLLISVNSSGVDVAEMWSVEFFVDLVHAASTTALNAGFALALAPTDAESLAARVEFDGAVVVDPVPGHYLVERALAEKRPLVTTGTTPGVVSTVIDYDYETIVDTVLNHLWRSGARAPGLLTSPSEASYVTRCRAAYKRWCDDRRVTPRISVTDRGLSEHVGYSAAEELLSSQQPVDAIFATLDRLAVGALAATHARGLSVPEDVKIVGLGDSELSERSSPSISSVDLLPSELGRRAVEQLVKTVESEAPAESCLVPTVLVVRESSSSSRSHVAYPAPSPEKPATGERRALPTSKAVKARRSRE